MDHFLGDILASPPYTHVDDHKDWARLFLVLDVMPGSRLEKLGHDVKARLIELLKRAQTFSEFAKKDVQASTLLERHLSPRFCALSSWTRREWDFGGAWYRFAYDVQSRGEEQSAASQESVTSKKKGGKAGGSVFPHRMDGVTKKRHGRQK